MAKPISIGPFAGIDNVHAADSSTFQIIGELEKRRMALVAATDVDLDDDGWPSSRTPTETVLELTTGLGGFSGAGWLLVQEAGTVSMVDTATPAKTTAVESLDAADPVRYHEFDDQVWWCNKESCGRIQRDGTVLNWGMAVPPTPTLGTTAGDLPAGIYQVAATYLDSAGIESGAAKAASIALNGSQDITATLTVNDTNAAYVRLYVAELDQKGQGALYWCKTVLASALPTTISDTRVSLYPLKTQFMRGPVPGRGIASYKGILITYRDNWLYLSSGISPHLFNVREVIRLPRNVQAVAGLDGALWIATEGGIFLVQGDTLANMTMVQMDSEPYAQGCAVVPGYVLPSLQMGGRLALFVNKGGLVVGLPTGQLGLATRRVLTVGSVVGKKASFAYAERDDLKQILFSLSDAVDEGVDYYPPETPYHVEVSPPATTGDWDALVDRVNDLEINQLPPGTAGDILVYNGAAWVSTTELPL
jgi:hypothetical protein